MSKSTTKHRSSQEITVKVPGGAHQIILGQMAKSMGVMAYVPGRSQKRIVLPCTASKAELVIENARLLGAIFELRIREALEQLLEDNSLEVPEDLRKDIRDIRSIVEVNSRLQRQKH